jgi:phenylacetate-coenzyme A ligase PaaK-like adenylate-forming protein
MTRADDLARLLARVEHAPSPFYRERLADRAEFARMPLTRRDDLLCDQLDHLPLGTRRFADAAHPVRLGITGSGDTLLVLAWSAADLARERAAGARLLGSLGIRAGMRVANTLPGALATPGSLLLGDVIEEIGALDVPLGAIDGEAAAGAAWDLIDRVEPTVLVLDATSGGALLEATPPGGRPWWRGIVWLRGLNAIEPPAVPSFDGWQRTWLAVPEATSFVAGSCGSGRFHVDEGVLAEVADAYTGDAVSPGCEGTLVLTPLGVDMPLIRYASGLTARLAAACDCGAGGTVMEIPATG